MNKVNCPEECIYRNKIVSFCGYCMRRIVQESEGEKRGTEQQKAADPEQAGSRGSRYGEEDHGSGLSGDHTHHKAAETGHVGYGVDPGTADGDQESQSHWVSY